MLDLDAFAKKIRSRRESLQVPVQSFVQQTGISTERLNRLESGKDAPTGDEVLIFADFYRTDYRYFVSSEAEKTLDTLQILFRRHGTELSPTDRWAINEFLFLCDSEEFILEQTGQARTEPPRFQKRGTFYKAQGWQAASQLRNELGYQETAVPVNVFDDIRRIGIHIFRRRLENSELSGLFVQHDRAGRCVLVNYSEDPYRQRFTAAHEAAHALLDYDQDFVLSHWKRNELVETRANAFAAHYLIPPSFIPTLRRVTLWTASQVIGLANKLRVSVAMLLTRLKEEKIISEEQRRDLAKVSVPRPDKIDAELGDGLSKASRQRKQSLLERGLSDYYVSLCLEAYDRGIVSRSRVAEMLLVSQVDLDDVAALFARKLGA